MSMMQSRTDHVMAPPGEPRVDKALAGVAVFAALGAVIVSGWGPWLGLHDAVCLPVSTAFVVIATIDLAMIFMHRNPP